MRVHQQRANVPLIASRFLVMVFVVAFCSQGFSKERKSPNIVIFLNDDHGQLDSTPYGSRGFRTPNIQRLADAGLTFTHAFVASPSCAPSRAALLTGLMPARNGAEANHSKPRPDLKKWPAYFQELGYEVVAFGKVSHYKHTADYILNLEPEFAFTTHIDLPSNLGQRPYWSTWESAARTNQEAASIVNRYHARPAEELYNLAADPHEQRNLANDSRHGSRLKRMRAELEGWMKSQGDQRTVFEIPRRLNDPSSYSPNALAR